MNAACFTQHGDSSTLLDILAHHITKNLSASFLICSPSFKHSSAKELKGQFESRIALVPSWLKPGSVLSHYCHIIFSRADSFTWSMYASCTSSYTVSYPMPNTSAMASQ